MKAVFITPHILKIKMNGMKIPWRLASHAFLIVLILVLLDLLLGILLFYNYVLLVKVEEPKITGETIVFKSNTYQEVLKEWQLKKQEFQQVPYLILR